MFGILKCSNIYQIFKTFRIFRIKIMFTFLHFQISVNFTIEHLSRTQLTEVAYSPREESVVSSTRESPKSETLQSNDSLSKILRAARS